MKIINIENNQSIKRRTLNTEPLFAFTEGWKKHDSKYAIIDNKENKHQDAILLTEQQLKDIILSIPLSIYKELIEEKKIIIEDNLIKQIITIRTSNENYLIGLGMSEEKVKDLPDSTLSNLVEQVENKILFVVDNELRDKNWIDNKERQILLEEANKWNIIDQNILNLRNEALRHYIDKHIEERKLSDEQLKQLLETLLKLVGDDEYRKHHNKSINAISILINEFINVYKTKFNILIDEIKKTDFVHKFKEENYEKNYDGYNKLEKEFNKFKDNEIKKNKSNLTSDNQSNANEIIAQDLNNQPQ